MSRSQSFVLVATNPAGVAQASVSVVVDSASTLPAWLVNVPLNEWCAISGTELSVSAVPEQIAAGLATGQYGDPRDGIMDYSGAALKNSGSEILIFGGGGAGAWAGNDVRGLRLEDDLPRWRTLVKPTHASLIPQRSVPGTQGVERNDNLDGTPIARHSYQGPQFINATDTFMAFGTEAVWTTDMGLFRDVRSVPLNTGVWTPAGTHPDIPGANIGTYGGLRCKHPVTEHVYAAGAIILSDFDPVANSWQIVMTNPVYPGSIMNNAYGAVDPVRNILCRANSVNGQPSTVDLAAKTYTAAVFSGPYAANVIASSKVGFVYDAGLDKFVMFRDDGYLYTFTYVSHAEYYVDRLPLTGTPPVVGASAMHGGAPYSVWSRMQYVPNLKGICIVQVSNKPAYFVRTI